MGLSLITWMFQDVPTTPCRSYAEALPNLLGWTDWTVAVAVGMSDALRAEPRPVPPRRGAVWPDHRVPSKAPTGAGQRPDGSKGRWADAPPMVSCYGMFFMDERQPSLLLRVDLRGQVSFELPLPIRQIPMKSAGGRSGPSCGLAVWCGSWHHSLQRPGGYYPQRYSTCRSMDVK